MFIVFGWPERKSGEQSLSTYCTGCQRDTVHKTFTQQSWFTLFFIPIFPIGAKHPHTTCNICGRDAHGKSSTGLSTSTARFKTCPKCAETIRLEAIICRHCGHQLTPEEIDRALKDAESRRRAEEEMALSNELSAKAKRFRLIGWLLFFPAALSFVLGLATIVGMAGEKGPNLFGRLLGGFFAWLLFSVPLVISMILLVRADKIRKQVKPKTVVMSMEPPVIARPASDGDRGNSGATSQ